jgi:hypothetical protein
MQGGETPESGGVGVLDISQGWNPYFPRKVGLPNALAVDERCDVFKGLGALSSVRAWYASVFGDGRPAHGNIEGVA